MLHGAAQPRHAARSGPTPSCCTERPNPVMLRGAAQPRHAARNAVKSQYLISEAETLARSCDGACAARSRSAQDDVLRIAG